MPDSLSSFFAKAAPDFRHMTPDEIRRGITTLNFLVRDLRRFEATGKTSFLHAWRPDTEEAKRAAEVLPSAALVTRMAEMPPGMDGMAGKVLGSHLVAEAEILRRKYKDVWRGRPRDKFHHVAARLQKRATKGPSFRR